MWWTLLWIHIAGFVVTTFTAVAYSSYEGNDLNTMNDDMAALLGMSFLGLWPLLWMMFAAHGLGATLRERKNRKVLTAKEEAARLYEIDQLLLKDK